MALVRFCQMCHGAFALTEPECPVCRVSLDGLPIVDDAAIPAPSGAGVAEQIDDAPDGHELLQRLRTREPGFVLRFEMLQIPVVARHGIGRDPDFCDHAAVFANLHAVSRRHAVVWLAGDRLMLEHQGENSSTWINGISCPRFAAQELAAGDTVEFGPGTRARVERRGGA